MISHLQGFKRNSQDDPASVKLSKSVQKQSKENTQANMLSQSYLSVVSVEHHTADAHGLRLTSKRKSYGDVSTDLTTAKNTVISLRHLKKTLCKLQL